MKSAVGRFQLISLAGTHHFISCACCEQAHVTLGETKNFKPSHSIQNFDMDACTLNGDAGGLQ